jgi:hypothetical protein
MLKFWIVSCKDIALRQLTSQNLQGVEQIADQ